MFGNVISYGAAPRPANSRATSARISVTGRSGTINRDKSDRPEPSLVQNVVAINGFAYGAIGADIHVFANGLPLYLLANWRAEGEADQGWLRELPSRMLNARYAVVPFTGRDHELAELHQWARNGSRLAVRWLHGPGGQGKTRLAAQFALELATAGWKVVKAIHGPGTVVPPPGSQDMRLGDATGLLMIVDYADRWPLTHLTWLFSNALLHQMGVPTRILLIARSTDAWPAVRAVLANHQARTSAQLLDALPDEPGRAGMFDAARDSFAARYDIGDAEAIGPPGPLADPDLGLTLALHMAALVAVDAHAHGQQPPKNVAALTIYLLDREHLHWANLYGDSTHEVCPANRAFHTHPGVMNQVVFAAALTGPVTRPVGTTILDGLHLDSDSDQILTDHGICYPASDPARPTVLEPLYPDRLAEDFLALTLPGHSADYPAQPWAPTTSTALIARGDDGTLPGHISRSLIFLAAAAAPGRWTHVSTHLNAILANDPALAVAAGSPALTAIAEAADVSVLEAIEALLPLHKHIDLDTGAAAISTKLASHMLGHTTDLAARAHIHATLDWRLANAGLHQAALAAAQESLVLYRRLAEASPAAHEPNLAMSLNNLGNRLAEAGYRQEALVPAQEAAALYRRLAKASPAAHEPNFAMSLSNLGNRLAEGGYRQEALVPAQEAAALYRRLAKASPAAHEPNLAMSLNNLGNRLAKAGQREEALVTSQEAVAIRRRLAEANPAVYEPDFAVSLNNLGNRLSEVGQGEEALAICREAVVLYRGLAEASPAVYELDLAMSLNNLGNRLSEAGQREEALAISQESAARYRCLAETSPAVYEPELAMSLKNLGNRLSEAGQREEALAICQEAVTLWRRLAENSPAVHQADLAMSLSNLGELLSDAGRREDALATSQESVALYRRLAEASPAPYQPGLATSLVVFARVRATFGLELDDALVAAGEALTIYQRLSERLPRVFSTDLRRAHQTRGKVLDGLSRKREAAIRRRQLDEPPP